MKKTKPEIARLELLLETSKLISSEIELQKLVQQVTDAATKLSGAEFGAFFYNLEDDRGETYQLYTISGVPIEAFSKFPMPRKTQIFAPTFDGIRTVRYDDVTQQPHYGRNEPFHAMPEGHLPVRSYLAVPVVNWKTEEVIGGLFFGHSQVGVFTEDVEKLVEGIAAQSAIAMTNARLFEQTQKARKQLTEQKQQYESVFNASSDAIFVFDYQGFIKEANPAASKLHGYSYDEHIGMHGTHFIHPDNQSNFAGFVEAGKAGKTFSTEGRHVRKDGSLIYVEVVGSGFLYKGEPHLLAMVRDVTERKVAEQELRASELFRQSLLESSPDSVKILDLNGNLVYINESGRELMEIEDPQRVKGNCWVNFWEEPYRQMALQAVESAKAGQVGRFTGRRPTFSGRINWWDVMVSPIYGNDDRVLQLLTVARNITKQKETEAELLRSEETLRLTIDATKMGIWDFNPKTGAISWSARTKEFFGVPPEEEVDYDKFLQALHPQDRERTIKAINKAVAYENEGKYDIEYRSIGLRNKRERWLRATGRVIEYDDRGDAVRFVGTILDITEEKRNRQMLEEKTRELEYANEDLKNFTYTITHDLKNPLSSIIMAANLAEDTHTVEEYRELMSMVGKSANKIDGILKGLVKIIQEEETKGIMERIDLSTVVSEVREDLADTLAATGGRIEVNATVGEVTYVRSYLQSILRNLIDNALKYRAPERQPFVRVSVKQENHHYVFRVADNGIGIDLDKHAKQLFQPFQRFSPHVPGTGIGLFMIKRMIEKHGGRLTVESRPGEGATFQFTINLM